MAAFTAHQQECEDEGWFGEWSNEHTYSMTLTSGGKIGSEKLGLSFEVSQAVTQGVNTRTTRRIQVSKGLRALHTPFGSSEDWEGKTYIQYYNKKNGDYGHLLSSISDHVQNFLGFNGYPWYFYLNNQEFIFKVRRTNVEVCHGYEHLHVARPPLIAVPAGAAPDHNPPVVLP